MKSEAGTQSKHTVLSFEVADITAEIRELEGRGVVFEDYDLPDLKTVNHIAAMGAEGVGPVRGLVFNTGGPPGSAIRRETFCAFMR